jgi:hypothetical protein
MAKHVIIEAYTFTPSTKTIVVTGKNIRREQLLLITNTTTGTVIYNFSDPALLATSYTNAVDASTGQETTTVVLSYNTASMASTDKISILTEESYQEMTPSEVLRDPVDKLRVSTPQALIDTDFEYGMQPTKWEALNLLNNRPSAFYDPTQGISNNSAILQFVGANSSAYQITNVTASAKVVTVAIGNTTGITVGLPIFIQGTLDVANCDGWWVVESVSTNTNFTFTVLNTPAAALFDATKTYLFIGAWFTGAVIPTGTSAISLSGSVATVTTTNAHGLRVGDGIYVVGATGMTGTLNSSWVVATTPTNNTFTFACTATGTITTVSNGSIYPRALGYVEHRPFDGGVQFSNVSPYHGYQVIRQTRRQFRYQSGKGVQFSTGSILKPAVAVDNITSSGTTVTVTTKFVHGMLSGSFVKVSGCTETAYNGTFLVTGATALTITYTALTTPSATPATGFPLTVSPFSWYGSANRVGMFDQQNGFFFEFDGQILYVVKRSSTQQLSGAVTVVNGSQSITGTATKFSSQLKPGDYTVIRGQSYLIQHITSDTQMYVYPEYRGVGAVNCIVSKTIDTKYPQSAWNIDKMDGTGSSLYNIDMTKMQMFYADYTWYGAGGIRFGFKNNRGEVIYCHRIVNNNVNTEAYMRSGNLPARYETNTLPVRTFLTATLTSGVTASMAVSDTTYFPSAGTLAITASAATGAAVEYITYTGKTATTFTGLTRNATGGTGTATTFTYSATSPITVESFSPGQASTISHWGSSVIMDGRYDDDKSILFNFGQNTPVVYATAGTRYPIFSVRLGPSVDGGLTGLIGAREIINRMQLTPASIGVYTTTAGVKVEVFLNSRVSAGTYSSVGGSSLAQVALHSNTTTISGGECIFTFFVAAGGTNGYDLSEVRDIGNSILGGGNTLNCPTTASNVYPDGPDILTICVTPLASNATVAARLNWTEAQA